MDDRLRCFYLATLCATIRVPVFWQGDGVEVLVGFFFFRRSFLGLPRGALPEAACVRIFRGVVMESVWGSKVCSEFLQDINHCFGRYIFHYNLALDINQYFWVLIFLFLEPGTCPLKQGARLKTSPNKKYVIVLFTALLEQCNSIRYYAYK